MSAPNSTASNHDFEFAALGEAANYRKAIIQEFAPWLKGNVAEVGAGIGQITEDISQLSSITKLIAVEPDERFHSYHEGKPWDLIKNTSASLQTNEGLNCIILINVLEHIEEDEEELRHLFELLKNSGDSLCLLVPACPELYAPIDHDFGHFRRYTKAELRRKLESAGFRMVRCDYFNWGGYLAWGLVMKWLKKRNFSRFGVRFYDRLIFPWVHWMELHLGRPPFGQSLIAVAKAGKSLIPS
jgi:hypothetical protein